VVLSFVIINLFPAVRADTIPENSIISGVWSIDNSPYIILGEATIPENDSLTIEPGVEILLRSSTNTDPDTGDFNFNHIHVGTIWVMGQLKAIGIESDSIVFTRNTDEGRWGTIAFLPGSNSFSEMKYCNISFSYCIEDYPGGQNNYPGSLCNKNKLIIGNCTVSNNYIGLCGSLSETIVSFSRFTNNTLGISEYFAELFLTSCEIKNSKIGIQCYAGSGVVSGSEIADCMEYGIHLYNTSFKITGNIFWNNLWNGIHCQDNPLDTVCYNIVTQSNSGIRCSGLSPVFYNNTIVDNNYFGFYLYYNSTPVILNTIINDNPSDFYIAAPGVNAVIAFSLLNNSSLPPEVTNAGGNLFNVDPLFVDYLNGDFNLEEGSPCIDAGTAYFEWNNQTIIHLLPQSYNGNAPDMGALESPFTVSDFSDQWKERLISVKCYPNPFSSQLQIITGEETVNKIYLLNTFCQKVFELNNIAKNNTIIYPAAELPKGLYYLIAETSGGRIVRKLIKN
jgi:parallel beta-helix repeat protein